MFILVAPGNWDSAMKRTEFRILCLSFSSCPLLEVFFGARAGDKGQLGPPASAPPRTESTPALTERSNGSELVFWLQLQQDFINNFQKLMFYLKSSYTLCESIPIPIQYA